MKKWSFLLLFLGTLSFLGTGTAQAVTFVDVIDFSTPLLAKDLTSGNSINTVYEHTIALVNTDRLVLTGAELSILHSGNVNEGPRRELWAAFSGDGHLIGNLSKSDPTAFEDEWALSQETLNEIRAVQPWRLQIGLSELTPFNSETMRVHQSKLTVHYEEPARTAASESSGVPESPEPATLLLVSISLLLGFGIKKLRRRG